MNVPILMVFGSMLKIGRHGDVAGTAVPWRSTQHLFVEKVQVQVHHVKSQRERMTCGSSRRWTVQKARGSFGPKLLLGRRVFTVENSGVMCREITITIEVHYLEKSPCSDAHKVEPGMNVRMIA